MLTYIGQRHESLEIAISASGVVKIYDHLRILPLYGKERMLTGNAEEIE